MCMCVRGRDIFLASSCKGVYNEGLLFAFDRSSRHSLDFTACYFTHTYLSQFIGAIIAITIHLVRASKPFFFFVHQDFSRTVFR